MIDTTAIRLRNPEPFLVTWEILRRCNLDCTYCESTRHDNHSSLPTIDELKRTFDFIRKYTEIYQSNKIQDTGVFIDFTGGEPTINPAFWELIDYIKQFPGYGMTLTTNGTWGKNFTQKIADNFKHVTVSWHAETSNELKQRTVNNIIDLHNMGISVQANVMLHSDHFSDAKLLCQQLREHDIRVHPTPIGDGNVLRKGWFVDTDGTNRKTSHDYTTEQQNWFFDFQGVPRKADSEQQGTNVGRACCGGRCTQGKVNGEWSDVKLVNTFFKDWHCMVNWYFLHIDQQTGNVHHHQTCKATHTGRGPIGNLSDTESIIDSVTALFSAESVPAIVCPNLRCGCGMCVPKAKEFTDFKELWKATTVIPIYEA